MWRAAAPMLLGLSVEVGPGVAGASVAGAGVSLRGGRSRQVSGRSPSLEAKVRQLLHRLVLVVIYPETVVEVLCKLPWETKQLDI